MMQFLDLTFIKFGGIYCGFYGRIFGGPQRGLLKYVLEGFSMNLLSL